MTLAPAPEPRTEMSGVTPSADPARDFKTAMMRINRAGWQELSRLSIDLDSTLEDLLIQAGNDLLRKHGRAGVIEKRRAYETRKRGQD
jgi:hypothetical protein